MAQDTNVENLIINKLTRAQYESIANPDPTQLYFVTDEVISSSDVVNALGYTPYNATNPDGFISGITSSDVTTALGYTPYNATNPDGFISSAAIASLTDVALTGLADGQVLKYNSTTQKWENSAASGGGTWGSITGTLSDQTDLQNALNTKQDVLTPANAGNCIQIAMGNPSRLPAEYQELEYLESSGTQYINTGVVLDNTMTIRIKYDFIRLGFVFGSRASTLYRYSGITNENSGVYNIRYGTAVIYTQETIPSGTVDVVISPNSVVLNGETVSTTAYGNSFYIGDCFLFTVNNNGRPQTGEYAVNRIRRFTIDNVIDFVPCRRKSDNVLGMYDLINDEFLTNAGTGDFIAGGDVEEITKINFVNDAGFISGITSSDVITALGYTPYDATNPNGYINASALNGYATETWITNQNYVNSTTLTDTLADYALLTDIPTVNNGTLTIQKNGATIGTFTANQSGNSTVNIEADTVLTDDITVSKNSDDELQAIGVIDDNSGNAIKTWTGTKAQYDAIVTKDSNTLYNIIDDSDVTFQLLDLIYPVGSIYIGTMSVCPLQVLGLGTWQLVAEDKVLQGAGTRGSVGSTLNESLPKPSHTHTRGDMNITGSIRMTGVENLYGSSGALSAGTSVTDWNKGHDNANTVNQLVFNASNSWTGSTSQPDGLPSTYQDDAPVQQDAYLVNIWERIS